MKSEIQEEIEENLRHIQRLIAKQEFSVGDAELLLLRYGNFALKMDSLEKSRNLCRDKYNKLKNTHTEQAVM